MGYQVYEVEKNENYKRKNKKRLVYKEKQVEKQ